MFKKKILKMRIQTKKINVKVSHSAGGGISAGGIIEANNDEQIKTFRIVAKFNASSFEQETYETKEKSMTLAEAVDYIASCEELGFKEVKSVNVTPKYMDLNK